MTQLHLFITYAHRLFSVAWSRFQMSWFWVVGPLRRVESECLRRGPFPLPAFDELLSRSAQAASHGLRFTVIASAVDMGEC